MSNVDLNDGVGPRKGQRQTRSMGVPARRTECTPMPPAAKRRLPAINARREAANAAFDQHMNGLNAQSSSFNSHMDGIDRSKPGPDQGKGLLARPQSALDQPLGASCRPPGAPRRAHGLR
jgi:hypothetical protein